ncbi:hypothetical protein SAMN05421642_1254 [Rhodococcoides kyotonense]|uniref:Uncharacterized protein n=1 Tax=Rhodococcoides kyotonense TaxID=398843 RepID=A0A239MYY2_9NOCA|nr:hypothetical protein SAMN05421642_1254 [Rhodococcus kyotonensis]
MNIRAAAVVVTVPILVSGIGIGTAVLWASDLPDRIAEQWTDSAVTSTTSISGIVLYLAVSGLTIAVFSGVATIRTGSRVGTVSSAGLGMALSLFITVSLVGLMATQRGVVDPDSVQGPPVGWIGAAAAVSIVGGGIGALVVKMCLPRTSARSVRARKSQSKAATDMSATVD